MGLTTLPKVGAGENLGPAKVPRPLQPGDVNRDILVGEHNAAMAGLEGVCAEVGLHDGSTVGSLVARVTALEGGGGGGTGDVVGPASAVLNHIAVFNATDGKLISDSSVDVAAIATAQSTADTAQSTANAKVAGPGSTIVSNVASWNGTDGLTLKDSGIPQSFILTGALGSGVSTLSVAGPTALVDASNRAHVIIDTTAIGGDCSITVPHNLTPQVRVDLRLKGAHGIVLGTSGGIALTYHGWTQGATITGDGTRVEIIAESATVAHVYVYTTGTGLAGTANTAAAAAQTTATDALYPLVQSAHTSATKTLAAGDAGDVIPMNGASNAIAVTIPHTLFAAGGTGRAFVCQIKVVSVAGGALTFAGSGGIVLAYYGKDPGADAYIAGDWLTIVVDSATTASIFAVEAL